MGGGLRFLLILYLNKATKGVFFMSFGNSFQARIVEGRKESVHSVVLNIYSILKVLCSCVLYLGSYNVREILCGNAMKHFVEKKFMLIVAILD